MERKEKILEFIKDKEYVPMKLKEMAQVLMVPKEEQEELQVILDELEKEYKIRKNRKNKYILMDEQYIEGVYEANKRGFGFVKITGSDEEIHIAKGYNNNALNGDTVVVKIIDEENVKTKEGKIVKIIKRDIDKIVGTFQNSRNFGFVVPDNDKIGTDIFISKKNFGGAKNNQKVVVKITKYPEKGKNAEGKIIEVIGNIDQAGVDMVCLIKEYNLPYEFPSFVLDEAEQIEDEIDKAEIENRRDLRDKTIFTIDGEDAKDLDDAVYVEKLSNGNYKLGVYIADVSHYVKEGTFLDKEALTRGTSIYMLDRVIPMLPKKLSNGICSLNQGKDRLVLAVEMEIDDTGKVVSSDVFKGVINVTRRMSYTNVTKILENSDEKIVNEYKEYIPNFKLMEELAKILENRRQVNGSLDLDIPESKITLDENGKAIAVGKYELTFANSIIEQFMLTANETIAEKFFWLEAPFVYRVHEVPDMEKITELNRFLYNFGYKIKGSKDNIHPKEFAKVLEEIKGKDEEMVLSTLILRTLKVARYEIENKGHFGISSKYYCHFTSPIRRYPDLFIHRIISKYLENNYNVTEEFKEEYNKIAENAAEQSSEKEKIAKKVERDSIDLKKAEFMQDKIGEVYDGIISSVTNFGIFVELENTVEGLIKFEDLGENEYFIYDDEHKHLIGERTSKIYKIGDKIRIQVLDANKETRKVAFAAYKDEI
ncbi:MAG: ribonuclease R [Clostridia bacterium]|nr:ribonuclease R [Clostridia bacterium]